MKKLLAIIAVAFFCTTAQAALLTISALPSSSPGGFQHNNFHDASTGNATSGSPLGWFDLGAGGGSYDTVTGAFVVNIDIYSDQGLTASIGTAVGTGNLTPSAWNGFDGGLIGSIFWDFTTSNAALVDTTTNFYDVYYPPGGDCSGNYGPNIRCSDSLTLWGANGDLDPGTGIYTNGVNRPTIGVDFVATFVPVPAAVWLFGSGLLAIAGIARRKARC